MPTPVRESFIAALTHGIDVDCRGVNFDEALLDAVMAAVTVNGSPTFGTARFDGAHFEGRAVFTKARFKGDANFDGAHFERDAVFTEAHFERQADFSGTHFEKTAHFWAARFQGETSFMNVHFENHAAFNESQFEHDARFEGAHFEGQATFTEGRFNSAARFNDSHFESSSWFNEAHFDDVAYFNKSHFASDVNFTDVQFSELACFPGVHFYRHANFYSSVFSRGFIGPLVCEGNLTLARAIFSQQMRIQISAKQIDATGARLESTSIFQLRYARVDLTDAALSQPVTLAEHPAPFSYSREQPMQEGRLTGQSVTPRIVSLTGVDAAHLVLTNANLSECVFSGSYHLDQIRLEGRCTFASPPLGRRVGWAWIPIRQWTRRHVLAEEHHWRALPHHSAVARFGWSPGPQPSDANSTPGPKDLAGLYRQLRKAFEDSKNEPGAADFYYGEMESRRHDKNTPRGERGLLHAYWLLSGYGLRSSRALLALISAMTFTVLLIIGFGLPDTSPKQQVTGNVSTDTGRQPLNLTIDSPDSRLTIPVIRRFTTKRTEAAIRVVFNSVVFRSGGQNLTTVGTVIEMAARCTQPALLGLAVLAVRGRVKRS